MTGHRPICHPADGARPPVAGSSACPETPFARARCANSSPRRPFRAAAQQKEA